MARLNSQNRGWQLLATLLLVFMTTPGSGVALADTNSSESSDEEDDEDESEEQKDKETRDEAPKARTVVAQTPERLRKQNLLLRLDTGVVDLNAPTVTFPMPLSFTDYTLWKRSGRLSAAGYAWRGPSLLNGVRERNFRIGAFAGVTADARGVLARHHVPTRRSATGLEVILQPDTIGVLVQIKGDQERNSIVGGDATVEYSQTVLRLGAMASFSLMRSLGGGHPAKSHGPQLIRTAEIGLLGGVAHSTHRYRISDDRVSVDEMSSNPAVWSGVEIRSLMFTNFWMTARYVSQLQRIKLEKFDVDAVDLQHDSTLGVSYAF